MTVLVKNWHWRSYVDMSHTNWLKHQFFFCVFLQKNGSLWHQGFIALLVVNYVCYIFVTVSDVAHGEDNRLKILCEGILPSPFPPLLDARMISLRKYADPLYVKLEKRKPPGIKPTKFNPESKILTRKISLHYSVRCQME